MTDLGALSEAASPVPPLRRFAGQIVSFASPLMRIRYPAGVYVDLAGFPTWIRYARAVVEFGEPDPRFGSHELRVTRVLAANQLMLRSDDPLWQQEEAGAGGTPYGWIWVHFARGQQMGLLPAELATAFRHWGGLATSGAAAGGGLPVKRSRTTVEWVGGVAAEADLAKLETELGRPLPAAYREFLGVANDGRPAAPALHPQCGFVLDQPLFGVGGKDWFHNVAYLRRWLSDRFTDDYLAVGRVQGGMLALKLSDPSAGSVWFWDADDVRDHDRYDAQVVTRDLLYRCGNGFDTFLRALAPVPAGLAGDAAAAAETGQIRLVTDPRIGTALPVAKRPPETTTLSGVSAPPVEPPPHVEYTWDSVRDLLRPMVRPATYGLTSDLEHGIRMLSRPVLPYLREFVVIEQGEVMRLVNAAEPEEWGVDAEQVFAIARANLDRETHRPGPDEPTADGPTLISIAGVEYAAALPLLDGWLASYAPRVAGRPVALIPGHSQLIVATGEDHQVADLVTYLDSLYGDSEKPISPVPYVIDDSGVLAPYPAAPGHPAEAPLRRAMARLAHTEYTYQQQVLEEHYEGVFVGSLLLGKRDDGVYETYASWGEGVDSLLPQADYVAFASDHMETFRVSWQTLTEHVVLVPEPGLDPPRYRVRGWPPAEVIEQLRRHAV